MCDRKMKKKERERKFIVCAGFFLLLLLFILCVCVWWVFCFNRSSISSVMLRSYLKECVIVYTRWFIKSVKFLWFHFEFSARARSLAPILFLVRTQLVCLNILEVWFARFEFEFEFEFEFKFGLEFVFLLPFWPTYSLFLTNYFCLLIVKSQ